MRSVVRNDNGLSVVAPAGLAKVHGLEMGAPSGSILRRRLNAIVVVESEFSRFHQLAPRAVVTQPVVGSN